MGEISVDQNIPSGGNGEKTNRGNLIEIIILDGMKPSMMRATTIRARKSKKNFINPNKEMTIDELKEYIL